MRNFIIQLSYLSLFLFPMTFLLRILLGLLAVAAGIVIADKTQLTLYALQRTDPLPHAQALFAEERYAEADLWLDFFMEFEYVHTDPQALALHAEIKKIRNGILFQIKKSLSGFFTGNSDETSGQIGAVVSDFLLFGDVRDLSVQSWNYVSGEEVDEVVLALSAIGVTATGAQIASAAGTAATAGAASPSLVGTTTAKAAVVMLKTAKRAGKLPNWLIKEIKLAAKTLQQNKSLGHFSDYFSDLKTLATTRGGLILLDSTADGASLRKMAIFSKKLEHKSHTVFQLAGNKAVDAAQTLKHEDELRTLRAASTYGEEGVSVMQRMGVDKFAKNIAKKSHKFKALYKHAPLWLLKWLAWLPLWVLFAVVALGIAAWWRWIKRLFWPIKKLINQ